MALLYSLVAILVSACACLAVPVQPGLSPVFSQDGICKLPSTDRKIISPTVARQGEFPSQVLLRYQNEFFCGGVIINPNLILTASHCVYNSLTRLLLNPEHMIVVAGEHDVCINEETEQIRNVSRIIPHRNYNSTTYENDIAILVLNSPLQMTDFVQGIKYPNSSSRPEYLDTATVVGWGRTNVPSDYFQTYVSRRLNKANVSFVSNAVCQTQFLERRIQTNITEGVLCAGTGEWRSDACQGDSGGALLCASRTEDKPILCGVVSYGGPCGFRTFHVPTVYTNVAHYADWIDSNSREILSAGKCKADEFTCSPYLGTTKCIPSDYVCDFDADCPNGEDEKNCPVFPPVATVTTPGPEISNEMIVVVGVCSWDQFTCESKSYRSFDTNLTISYCIPFGGYCNGVKDCSNNKDEENCPRTTPTSAPARIASNTTTTPSTFSTTQKPTTTIKPKSCRSGYVRCYNGKCIPKKHLCNGKNDCGQNEDEDFELCQFNRNFSNGRN